MPQGSIWMATCLVAKLASVAMAETSTDRRDPMKQQRHAAIREVINQSPVPSQDELRRRLARRGFHVTQATLSRDIHELRLSKGPAGYALPGNPPDDDEDSLPGIREVLGSFGIEVRQAMNQLVLI